MAALALGNLAGNSDNKVAIACAGAVDLLVQLLRTGVWGREGEVHGSACAEQPCREIRQPGRHCACGDPLVQLLRTGDIFR
eukprot:5740214-Pyramimonas_sp.AAC.1